jgi:type I restriction enzyme, S subunit
MGSIVTQGVQAGIRSNDLKRLSVICPPIDVQNRIADIIEVYDNLIENNRRRIALLEESARLLYREWFVHFRFPEHEYTKIISGVPEGWSYSNLGAILTLNYGKALKADNRIPGIFPVYGSSGVVGSHNKALVPGSGIIVGRKGNVGSIYWCSKDFYPIDTVYFNNNQGSNLYLYYVLQHVYFINTDVAVPGLNRDMAYSREILIPPDTLLENFLRIVTPISHQIEKLDEYNLKLSEARDLLLPRLMNGEISV